MCMEVDGYLNTSPRQQVALMRTMALNGICVTAVRGSGYRPRSLNGRQNVLRCLSGIAFRPDHCVGGRFSPDDTLVIAGCLSGEVEKII